MPEIAPKEKRAKSSLTAFQAFFGKPCCRQTKYNSTGPKTRSKCEGQVSIEKMSTPGERLSVHKQVLRNPTGNEDVTYRSTPLAAEVDCAIEITEALIGLKVAVDSMANQVATVMMNLTAEINEATAQAVISSSESTRWLTKALPCHENLTG